MSSLVEIICAQDAAIRDCALDTACKGKSLEFLLSEGEALENMRHRNDNLYEKVRGLFFLYAIHRFHIPFNKDTSEKSVIPYDAYEHILNRRFEEAIEMLLERQRECGANKGLSSALAETYKKLAFQTLADQVRKSVRSTLGNQWMFRTGHHHDHPLKIKKDLLQIDRETGLYPILREATPVRMDLSHSGWSDIFFLGMDYPDGAKVLNISVDLSIWESNSEDPKPPIETFLRIIDEPILRLTSVDLGVSADIDKLADVFDFAKDYLGLIKAAIIASGIIPPAMEGADIRLKELFAQIIGPGYGLEIISQVNGIPKGSRLAVSTNLLASLISVCMRASGQTTSMTGQLLEHERRLVAARAILGEWIGGSGGGWQDSGGVWPGIKLIQGVLSHDGDPEFGISKGRLLPKHTILTTDQISDNTRKKLQESLVLVHGGMAQDVGPILEMVTEKYLLRSSKEWEARKEALKIYDALVEKLKTGDIRALGAYTTRNFEGPIQSIIPWASNKYTELIIETVKSAFKDDFWGFWMLGGMSGGGMGFIFDPKRKLEGQVFLKEVMGNLKRKFEKSIPFAMEPVVYNFSINENGTFAQLKTGREALLPTGYYALRVPLVLREEMQNIPIHQRKELEQLGAACKTDTAYAGFVATLFDRMIPQAGKETSQEQSLEKLLENHGFDAVFHSQLKADLKSGRIGLSQNRLPISTKISDAEAGDVENALNGLDQTFFHTGMEALQRGELAIVSLAGGAGSRWTKGAGVVKSLNPFAKLQGKHRNFIEIHLSKSAQVSAQCGTKIPHIFTTSYLTHHAISQSLSETNNYGYSGPVYLSEGKVIGLRMVPMARDLRFEWEEMPQQLLDEQQQKMQHSLHDALIAWAKNAGEGADYTDNLPQQCVHPVGHWYEVPNLLINGTLERLIEERPQVKHLMVHNIDTLGANADPALFGLHLHKGAVLTTEVISRNLEDRGGGLARINGNLRLIEGLALSDEKIEFELSYYNSSTTWVDIDQLLQVFGLGRHQLSDKKVVKDAIRAMAHRMPTYITIKDVKKRWGKGQEDVFPVTQFEKLWGDMTSLPGLSCAYVAVPRMRGQQLKEVAQLDGWLRDGSADYLQSICDWG
ncbi:MAG: UTP--glucose-1-phosphate uridylyltransferase [Cyclobacteriaceae bacterium]|nr:UTP--glucose-1-phosphate uridylyltransferase [Cyclobacteriaceae bacterium]